VPTDPDAQASGIRYRFGYYPLLERACGGVGRPFDDLGSEHLHYVRIRDALAGLQTNDNGGRVEVAAPRPTHTYVLKPIELVQEDRPLDRRIERQIGFRSGESRSRIPGLIRAFLRGTYNVGKVIVQCSEQKQSA
jgi:hypothetical protein